nr:alpha-glucosidase 2-like isoform X1 [Danaus plexippus plexippus]
MVLNPNVLLSDITWYDRILLNRPIKVVLALFLAAVVSPLLLYRYSFFVSINLPPSDGFSIGSCLIPRSTRLPCGNGSSLQEHCHSQCCFDLNLHVCYHRLPSRFSYIMNQPWNENITLSPRIATEPYAFQNSIPAVRLSVDEVTATHMTLTFYNSRNISLNGRRLQNKEYSYTVTSPELNIVVRASNRTIFNTASGPFIASDNIWEMSFILTNEMMYGLGEIPLKKNNTKVIYSHKGGFSSVPLIFAKLNNSYHGLLFDANDPTEIFISLENHVVVRSITNFGLKFHLFSGPEPKDIMKDVMAITGKYNKLEYWMLGVHICSEVQGLELNAFLKNATAERMPFDSHCGVQPIVFTSDQCNSNDINNIDAINAGSKLLETAQKKFVPHVSPYIRYEIKNDTDIQNTTTFTEYNVSCEIMPHFDKLMYRTPNAHEVYTGEINDFAVIYPNYEDAPPEFLESLWAYNKKIDGIVLENNFPLDEKEKDLEEMSLYLPYFSQHFKNAFNYTPPWNLTLADYNQSYLFQHNRYGNNFVDAFIKRSNDIPVWSSSLWLNSGTNINRQSINASWLNLNNELVNAALGGVSGHWLWSSPICGDTEYFNPETQTNLCIKWYLAAVYLPIVKIHSKVIPRHPTAFVGTHKTLAIEAIGRRYSLLPYYYTVLQEGPLLRPMFYQYPASQAIRDLSSQFNVGDSLLIAPNLLPLQSHVQIRKPPGSWYELWSGTKLQGQEGDLLTLSTTDADLMTFIKGGSVILIQKKTELSASDTLLTEFNAIIALECIEENVCSASGKQFVTDGLTLVFEANAQNMTISAIGNDFMPMCDFNSGTWGYDIKLYSIYGLPDEINNMDNQRQVSQFTDLCNLEYGDNIVIKFLT